MTVGGQRYTSAATRPGKPRSTGILSQNQAACNVLPYRPSYPGPTNFPVISINLSSITSV